MGVSSSRVKISMATLDDDTTMLSRYVGRKQPFDQHLNPEEEMCQKHPLGCPPMSYIYVTLHDNGSTGSEF